MPQRTYPDTRDEASESKFYIPAGTEPSFIASRFERLWAALFNHRVDPRK